MGFTTDLMVRRLAGSDITDRSGYVVVRTRANPRFHWGNFILVPGNPADDELARWIGVFTSEFPGAGHVAIGFDTVESPESPESPDGPAPSAAEGPGGRPEPEAGARSGAMGERAGVGIEVSRVLVAPSLLRPAPPSGRPELRILGRDDDWAQLLGLRQAVAEDEGPSSEDHQAFLRGSVEEARALSSTGRAAYFGAFVEDRLCSSLGVVAEPGGSARYQTVETLSDFRRRGLAGNLVFLAARHALGPLGATGLVIVSDLEGAGPRLYRSLGFRDHEFQWEAYRATP